jgi:hypothetical protein
MKKEMEHIDDFINRKLNEQDFPYQEEYWASAEKLIVAHDESRRRKFIFWACIILIIGLSALMILTNAFKRDVSAAVKQEDQNKKIPAEKNRVTEIASIKNNNDNDLTIERAHILSKENTTIKTQKTSITDDDINNNDQQEVTKNIQQTTKKKDQTHTVTSRSSVTKKKLKRNKLIRTVEVGDDKSLTEEREMNLSKIEIRNPQSEIRNDILLPFNSDGYVDDAKVNLKSYKHFIGIHGGLLYDHRIQPRPVMGLYYIYQHNTTWAFEARFNFKSPLLNNIEQKMVNTKYDFGKSTTEVIYKSKQSYELELPLLVKYRVFGKHHLSAGVSVNKILGVQYEKISREEDNFTASESREKMISSDHLNPFYLQLKTGYDIALIKPLRLELGLSYNITDPVKDKFYTTKSADHFQYTISVSYNLLRWK